MNLLPITIVCLLILAGIFIHKKKTGHFFFTKKVIHKRLGFLVHRKKKIIKIDQDTALEKSWEFFSKIANIVIHKFSRQDQDALLRIGIELEKAGMQYSHVLDFIEIKKSLAPTVTKEHEVTKQRSK